MQLELLNLYVGNHYFHLTRYLLGYYLVCGLLLCWRCHVIIIGALDPAPPLWRPVQSFPPLCRLTSNQMPSVTYRDLILYNHLCLQSSHKTFKIKRFLAKKQKQNRPIPQWIRMKTGNKIRYGFSSTYSMVRHLSDIFEPGFCPACSQGPYKSFESLASSTVHFLQNLCKDI